MQPIILNSTQARENKNFLLVFKSLRQLLYVILNLTSARSALFVHDACKLSCHNNNIMIFTN